MSKLDGRLNSPSDSDGDVSADISSLKPYCFEPEIPQQKIRKTYQTAAAIKIILSCNWSQG